VTEAPAKPRKKMGRPTKFRCVCGHCAKIKKNDEMQSESICKECYNTEMGVSNG
jgi:hypothetical protein